VETGSEFVGLCPLHEEAHPSFYVNTHKNLFYCHGCHLYGQNTVPKHRERNTCGLEASTLASSLLV
jgi:CHC2 zinc finger